MYRPPQLCEAWLFGPNVFKVCHHFVDKGESRGAIVLIMSVLTLQDNKTIVTWRLVPTITLGMEIYS
jgi:hypothetical protein